MGDVDDDMKSPRESPSVSSPRAPSALSIVLSHFATDTPSVILDRNIPAADPTTVDRAAHPHQIDPRLPPNYDKTSWLYVAGNDAFNNINTIWTAISPHCNEDSCALMEAGKVQWRWAEPGGKPRSVAACQYIESGLTDIEKKLVAAKVTGQLSTDDTQRIFKYIFRAYAHIYYKHYNVLRDDSIYGNDDDASAAAAANQHRASRQRLNASFKHLAMYLLEWNILDQKEVTPLAALMAPMVPLLNKGKSGVVASASSNQLSPEDNQSSYAAAIAATAAFIQPGQGPSPAAAAAVVVAPSSGVVFVPVSSSTEPIAPADVSVDVPTLSAPPPASEVKSGASDLPDRPDTSAEGKDTKAPLSPAAAASDKPKKDDKGACCIIM